MRLAIISIAALLSLSLAGPAGAAPPTPIDQYKIDCANFLNFVPRIVRREAVAAIGPDAHVTVNPFCRGVPYFDSGNAGGLRRVIIDNPTLVRALAKAGWRPDDVVSLEIRGKSVDLYVHRN